MRLFERLINIMFMMIIFKMSQLKRNFSAFCIFFSKKEIPNHRIVINDGLANAN